MRWLRWSAMPTWLLSAIVWFKRATGIGYRRFPSLVESGEIDPYVNSRVEAHARAMVREVEELDRELRRSGLANPRKR